MVARRQREFANAGVTAGTRVVIAHGGTPAFFADLFAAWSLGASALKVAPETVADDAAIGITELG